jgi:hypothetical protein
LRPIALCLERGCREVDVDAGHLGRRLRHRGVCLGGGNRFACTSDAWSATSDACSGASDACSDGVAVHEGVRCRPDPAGGELQPRGQRPCLVGRPRQEDGPQRDGVLARRPECGMRESV